MRRQLRSSYPTTHPMMPLAAPVAQVYSFRQPASGTVTVTQTANAPTLGAFNFVLSSATNYTAFTDLFDVYRVDYLEFQFYSRNTAHDLSTSATDISPDILTVIDKDDSVAPGTLDALREYSSLETHPCSEPVFVRRLKPGILTGAFDGTSVVACRSEIGAWIDCSRIGIPHYGLKYGVTAGAAGQTNLGSWDVQLFVGLSFKYIR